MTSNQKSAAAPAVKKRRTARLLLAPIALSAFVATWGGWVGLAEKTGFGEVNLLPGFVKADAWSTVNLGIALPLGVEAYAAYAMSVWFGAGYTIRAKRFAAASAVFSLLLAAAGQISYHVLEAKQIEHAPAWLVGFVSCLPVLVIGMAAALHHLTGAAGGLSHAGPDTPLGRIWGAATNLAVSRLQRAAETPPTVPAETMPQSQDATPGTSRDGDAETPGVPAGTSQADAERVVSPNQVGVPAAQPVGTLEKPSRDDLIRQVHAWRKETPAVSYAEIGHRLGVSKSEAGRLGRDAAKQFGETIPALASVPFPLPSHPEPPAEMNGSAVLAHTEN